VLNSGRDQHHTRLGENISFAKFEERGLNFKKDHVTQTTPHTGGFLVFYSWGETCRSRSIAKFRPNERSVIHSKKY